MADSRDDVRGALNAESCGHRVPDRRRATRGHCSAENLIAYTFGVGIKIFMLHLIVGLGSQIARAWILLIQSSTFFGPPSRFFRL